MADELVVTVGWVNIPEKEFQFLPVGHSAFAIHGNTHRKAVFNRTGMCVGWIHPAHTFYRVTNAAQLYSDGLQLCHNNPFNPPDETCVEREAWRYKSES